MSRVDGGEWSTHVTAAGKGAGTHVLLLMDQDGDVDAAYPSIPPATDIDQGDVISSAP